MTKEMREYIRLTVRLEAAANMVLEHGLNRETRLELEEAVDGLAKWIRDNHDSRN